MRCASFNPKAIGTSMLAVLAAAALPAYAQIGAHLPAGDYSPLETVTVTATRREQPLQSVPVAVSVLNGSELEQANLNTLEDIVRRVPEAEFRTGTSIKNVATFIRGVGTITTSAGIEPTISTVVDGVVLAHQGQTTMELFDLDRVEVLRGPQGTLFGKNASGGVFNIVTRDPSREQYRYADAAYDGGNEKRLRMSVGEELSEGVAWGSFSALYGNFDGNVTNVNNGQKVNGYDRKGVRGKLVMKPQGDLKITLGADYQDSTRTTTPVYTIQPNPGLSPQATVVASPTNRDVDLTYGIINQDRHWGVSGQIDWNLGGYALTSLTALRQWDNRQQQDIELSPLNLANDAGAVSFRQVSEELRLASPKGDLFEYVVGAFYAQTYDSEWYRRRIQVIADVTGLAHFGVDNRNVALFGEGSFKLSPTSRLMAGLRRTYNTVSYRHQRTTTPPVEMGAFMHDSFSAADATKANGDSGRFGAQFDLAPKTMAYATYSRGYKGPAYNLYANMWAPDTKVVRPEISDAYELGLKTQAMNNRLRFNLALFSARYKDYQTTIEETEGTLTVLRLVNAGTVGTRGLEADVAFKPGSRWNLTGAYAFTDARVLNFNCAVLSSGCVPSATPLPFAPRHRATLGATYTEPLADGRALIVGGDYRWQSEMQFQLPQDSAAKQAAYGIVNASIALDDAAHGWRLTLHGKNLGNRSYATYMYSQMDGAVRFVPRDDRRYFGIDFRQDF